MVTMNSIIIIMLTYVYRDVRVGVVSMCGRQEMEVQMMTVTVMDMLPLCGLSL